MPTEFYSKQHWKVTCFLGVDGLLCGAYLIFHFTWSWCKTFLLWFD